MSSGLHVESLGGGSAWVLLHGWAMHSGLWGPLLPRLAAQHRVHLVDLPGHGHSKDAAPVTLTAMVERLVRHFEGEAPLTVLGWSLGAVVAMRWALTAPRQVSALVLVGATPRFVSAPDWPHGMSESTLARFADELKVAYKLTLQRFLALQLQGGEAGRSSLATMRHALFARGEPSAAALSAALELLRTTDMRGDVAAIAQPTLVISGERDTLAAPEAGRSLAQALPRGKFVLLPGAAHVPFLSHPEAFAAALEELEHEA